MRTYVLTMFWVTFAVLALRLLAVGLLNWPYKREHTLGEAVFGCILSLAFLLWAGWLLWGAPQ